MLGRVVLFVVPAAGAPALTASAGACASACGIALDATVASEHALAIEHPGREEIVASFDLKSAGGERGAVVLDKATTAPRMTATGGDGETAGAGPPEPDALRARRRPAQRRGSTRATTARSPS
jgi:hypothetical protein